MEDPEHVRNLCESATIRRRVKVESSMISELGYDPATKIMEVQFSNNHAVYRYPKISDFDFTSLLNAESVGEHFVAYIKTRLCCPWSK